MKPEATRPKKKPYRPPRLVVYGDLRRLTLSKQGTRADGGGKPATRLVGPNS